ncbi:deoxyribonuclease IV [Isosphaeraceae bacterium EP7]
MAHLLGAHMSIAGGHDRAIRAANAANCTSLQIFTKNNNQWAAPALKEEGVAAFRQLLDESKISRPVAHNSYLINLASADDLLWRKSIAAMIVELERGEALGLADLVAHPGAHVGSGEEEGLKRIAEGLDEIHRATRGLEIRIALETTAGQGSCLGHRFEHLARIMDEVAEPERLGVCVDTCHLFAAGYRLGTQLEYDETFGEFDRLVGLGRVRVLHLNDSAREFGCRVDRHAGIGLGHLGLEPFGFVLNDRRFAGLPMVLETPKGTVDGEDLDLINLRRLRSLIREVGA